MRNGDIEGEPIFISILKKRSKLYKYKSVNDNRFCHEFVPYYEHLEWTY